MNSVALGELFTDPQTANPTTGENAFEPRIPYCMIILSQNTPLSSACASDSAQRRR